MSQIKFKTTYQNKPVEVMAGWDKPLSYYHLTIFNLDPEEEDEETIYSDLEEPNPFGVKNVEVIKKKLDSFGIEVPDGFWDKVAEKRGNWIEIYDGYRWVVLP